MSSPPLARGAARPRGLWRHADFLKLWAGQTISLFGSLISGFALPLIAALALGAGPLQMALLAAVRVAPGLALGLAAGVWVDRLRRRPVLIAADLGRALALATIPAAALAHALRVEQLYAVAFITSVLGVLFDVAYPAYLPSLLARDELVEGNSKIGASGAVAEVAGFGVAGVLVQALTAPIAVLFDAASFVVSAASLLLIRAPEPAPAPAPHHARHGAWREMAEGFGFVVSDPVRRALAGSGAVGALFGNMIGATIILFIVRDLRMGPALMGAIFAVGGVSSFAGALLARRLTRGLGLGRALLAMGALDAACRFCIPLAGGPPALAAALLSAEQASDGAGTIVMVDRLSLLQSVTPGRLQGRVHASLQVIEGGATLAGLFLGGLLGQMIGLRATLFVACAGGLIELAWLALSPVRRLREMPAVEDDEGAAAAPSEIVAARAP